MLNKSPATIRLIIADGCRGAFYSATGGKEGEVLHTRTDLFSYRGGYSWGYQGTGCQFLSYSIAAKIFEGQDLTDSQIGSAARAILTEVVSQLDGEENHDLKVSELIDVAKQSL